MSNLEIMKNKLIEKIRALNEIELYQLLGEIESIKYSLEEKELYPNDLFWCNDCRKKYGDCEDDNGEADICICQQRFIDFCKEHVKE